jgi:hypothetical protein
MTWIPSHKGIDGNERVNEIVHFADVLERPHFPNYFKKLAKQLMLENGKLHEIWRKRGDLLTRYSRISHLAYAEKRSCGVKFFDEKQNGVTYIF